ncbi:MAG: hypothetical protein Q4G16_08905 [Cruoricaptor ignavus]|nr:hypothetical protein [Cruoricaptor ignavus]
MKYTWFTYLFIALALFSCRGENESDLQKIDQILDIYIKNSAGQDLLNREVSGAYYSVELRDLGALRDRVAVSTTRGTDSDTIQYIRYIAGAERTLQDGGTDVYKIYTSAFAVQYRTSSSAEVQEDRMTIYYEWTPQLFQIRNIDYNGTTIFTKTANLPNTITIVK